jgi:hypothetical protein
MSEPTVDEALGMAWWNALSEAERLRWHETAGSAVPADAWRVWNERQAELTRQQACG